MLDASVYPDDFVRRNLPPAELWPVIDHEALKAYGYPQRFNAAVELLDVAVQRGYGDRPCIRAGKTVWSYAELLDKANRAAASHRSFLAQAFMAIDAAGLAVLLFFVQGYAARSARAVRANRLAYAYVAPAMIGMLVLVFFPFFYGITLSFTDANLYNSDKSIADTWIGMRNFTDILSDYHLVRSTDEGWVFNYDNFYYTLIFTILWTVFNVAIGVGLGLILALMLNTKGLALRPIYRVLLILPWAMPNYITALIWKGMFHRQFGVINQVLQIFGGSTTTFAVNVPSGSFTFEP